MDEPSVLQVVNSVRAGAAEDVLTTGELIDDVDDSAREFKGSKSLLIIVTLASHTEMVLQGPSCSLQSSALCLCATLRSMG